MSASGDAIHTLHARGWTDSTIGRMVGRDSSLVHQISVGKKPGRNLTESLESLVKSGLSGPKSTKQLPNVPVISPERRRRAGGLPARVRESGNRASSPGGARELPNGTRYIKGGTKGSARFAATVADGLSGNARIKVAYKGVDGKWHTVAQKGGMSPEVLRRYLGSGRSWRDALAEMIAKYYPRGGGVAPTGEAEFYIVNLGAA